MRASEKLFSPINFSLPPASWWEGAARCTELYSTYCAQLQTRKLRISEKLVNPNNFHSPPTSARCTEQYSIYCVQLQTVYSTFQYSQCPYDTPTLVFSIRCVRKNCSLWRDDSKHVFTASNNLQRHERHGIFGGQRHVTSRVTSFRT